MYCTFQAKITRQKPLWRLAALFKLLLFNNLLIVLEF
jgi:hypothetical protein